VDLAKDPHALGIKDTTTMVRGAIKVHVCWARRKLLPGESIVASFARDQDRVSYVLMRTEENSEPQD
jgi:hypothetical protein